MYTEDVDFCAALRARGRRILFTPEAEIVHLRGRSAARAPAATRAAYRKSHLAFYENTGGAAAEPWTYWRLEGPGFVWCFRVLPHVHTFVNIASKV